MREQIGLPADLLPRAESATGPEMTLSDSVEAAEKEAIAAALAAAENHRERTADTLGISVRTLHYKMSRYGLH